MTGANHGIGAETALALARGGAAVLATYLRAEDRELDGLPRDYSRTRARDAGWVVDEIRAAGGRAEAVEADLSDPETPARLFDMAEAALGPVAILVSNASSWLQDSFSSATEDAIGRPLQPVTAATFDVQFSVDARATALLIGELGRRHVARDADWGRIVTLTSSGRDGFPSEVTYGAAKAALESYTLSAAHELGPVGITANVVHPPVTDTGWIVDEHRTTLAELSPLGSIADPRQVADVIDWLCGDAAARVTANVILLA